MIAIRVRIKFDGYLRKAQKLKGEIPKEAERALLTLAHDALELIENAPIDERRRFAARQLARQFSAIFVPVTLKHKRPEKWPNLRAIYQARIVRGQKTFDGRKVLYVDERKEDALFQELLRRGAEGGDRSEYEVRFLTTYDRRYRVEIVRRGGGKIPPVVIAFARQRMKVVATETLTVALSKAGLR